MCVGFGVTLPHLQILIGSGFHFASLNKGVDQDINLGIHASTITICFKNSAM